MQRKLVIEAKLLDDCATGIFRVIEQTHIGDDFVDIEGNLHFSCTVDGITIKLYSMTGEYDGTNQQDSYFQYNPNNSSVMHVYVIGDGNKDRPYAAPFPAQYWPYIKATVEAYNKTYADWED